MHTTALYSVIEAKNLYQEFVGNSSLVFQNNSLNYKYITKVAEEILPNSLLYESSSIDGNHDQQIHWMIEKLEEIKRKAEKTKYFYSNRQTKNKI